MIWEFYKIFKYTDETKNVNFLFLAVRDIKFDV